MKISFLSFQWDNPFASAGGKGATSDLDIFLLDEHDSIVFAGAESNIGFDAVELLFFTNERNTAAEYKLLIGQNKTAGGEAPNFIKYIDLTATTLDAEYSTFSSTIFGHPNANGAEAVGASFYQTPTELESFSSVGITPILFDRHGDRLSEPEIRHKPEIVAPDGTNTTFFGTEDVEGDGFPNFFGTSAAAPHAAGVAALLLEAKPDATPELIYQVLEQTAIDLDDPFTPGEDIGFDVGSGFGLIQADLALDALI
ncbi:MAG: S8 family serine peptidase [Xenococcaceae cyanobacterium MO_188.B32]|nr:S8 family serine peptidase [Xenococcaceae cyanobacterium MO_188.B32]